MTSIDMPRRADAGRAAAPALVPVRIEFHGPFRIGTGLAAPGVTGGVDPANLLPASTLKGLMRASATRLLPERQDLVEQVFGMRPADPPAGIGDVGREPGAARGFDGASPWHWSSAAAEPQDQQPGSSGGATVHNAEAEDRDDSGGPDQPQPRESGRPADGAGLLAGVRITPRARVAIDADSGAARRDFLALEHEVWARSASFVITQTGHLTSEQLAVHRTVLACAAAGVHALGAGRRRGRGWVTLRPQDPAVDQALLEQLLRLRGAEVTVEGHADA